MAKTVILIDDDPDDLEIMTAAINAIDPTLMCSVYVQAEEALRLLSHGLQSLPNYIFIDINMPRKTGAQCLEHLRKVKELNDVPIIIYSTSLPERTSKTLLEAGANFTFQKPCTINDYVNVLRRILRP